MAKKKWQPEFDGAWLDYTRIGFGQALFALYLRNSITPVCLIWGNLYGNDANGTTFDILGCYVPNFARRTGCATFTLNQLVESQGYKLLTTSLSKTGGRPLGEKFGFLLDPDAGVWVYRPKKPRKPPRNDA